MNLLDAYRALYEGLCISYTTSYGSKSNTVKLKDDKTGLLYWEDTVWSKYGDLFSLNFADSDFAIVEDPEERLQKFLKEAEELDTPDLGFDGAIEVILNHGQVQVHIPWEVTPRKVQANASGVSNKAINLLHTADCRGWKITEVLL